MATNSYRAAHPTFTREQRNQSLWYMHIALHYCLAACKDGRHGTMKGLLGATGRDNKILITTRSETLAIALCIAAKAGCPSHPMSRDKRLPLYRRAEKAVENIYWWTRTTIDADAYEGRLLEDEA